MSRNMKLFVVAGLLIASGLALFVSPWADSDPDGLNRVAIDKGFAGDERKHDLSGSPVADYSVTGVGNERVSKALSGLIGVIVTFAVATGFFVWVRRREAARDVNTGDGGPA